MKNIIKVALFQEKVDLYNKEKKIIKSFENKKKDLDIFLII